MFFCIHLIPMFYMVQVFQGLGFSGSRVFKDNVEVLKVALPQMDKWNHKYDARNSQVVL